MREGFFILRSDVWKKIINYRNKLKIKAFSVSEEGSHEHKIH